MKSLIATTLAGMLALGSTAVFAQHTPPQQTQAQNGMNAQPASPEACERRYPQFSQLDAKHQGYISKQGATKIPGLSEIFQQADTNHDGKLTATEYTAWVQRVCKGHAGI